MSKPLTLVFVPGAWHKASCYDKTTEVLFKKHKLQSIAVTLPSTEGDRNACLKNDIDAVAVAISAETKRGQNVVVIAHSYGGMVGNSVIKDFTPNNETPEGHGNVIGLILIATGFTLTGMAFMDPFFGKPPPLWRPNWDTGFAEIVLDPRDAFYHDMPKEEGEYRVSQLTPQSLKSLYEGGEHSYAGWLNVPVWYIGTVEDHGMPVVMQRMTVAMAREMGANVEHRELQTSHSPFLSQPEATSQIIREALEAFTGEKIEDVMPTDAKQDNKIILAGAKFLAPYTWFKYGLPSIFGRILGRTYLIVTGGLRLWRGR